MSLHGSSSVFLLLLTNTRSELWQWSFHGFLNLNFFTPVVALVNSLHRFQKTFRTLRPRLYLHWFQRLCFSGYWVLVLAVRYFTIIYSLCTSLVLAALLQRVVGAWAVVIPLLNFSCNLPQLESLPIWILARPDGQRIPICAFVGTSSSLVS
jgi:hypothetical protein